MENSNGQQCFNHLISSRRYQHHLFKNIINFLLFISILVSSVGYPQASVLAKAEDTLASAALDRLITNEKVSENIDTASEKIESINATHLSKNLSSRTNQQTTSGSGEFWLNFYDGSVRPLKITLKDGQAIEQIGTTGGSSIIGIASVPGQSKIAYYLTSSNQVWKTVDGGKNFLQQVSLSITEGAAKDIFVNPLNPQEVYVFRIWDKNFNEHYGYLHHSFDGGVTWNQVQLPNALIRSGEASALMNSKGTIVVVVESGKGSTCRGEYNVVVWRSTDKGNSWQSVWQTCNDGTNGLFGFANSVAYSQSNPFVWYATVNASFGSPYYQGIIRSNNDGISWNYYPILSPITGAKVVDVAGDSKNPDLVLALLEGLGVYKSSNGGSTWSQLFANTAVNTSWRIKADPDEPGNFWLTGKNVADILNKGSLYRIQTIDNGVNWSYTRIVSQYSISGTFDITAPAIVPLISIIDAGNGSTCPARYGNTQEPVGGPINPLTGGYDYSFEDITLDTLAGPLSFKRTYSSLAIQYSSNTGKGWTHNHDLRLIFPDGNNPESVPGYVIFKGESSNRYQFLDMGNGTYEPYPGLCSTLIKQTDAQGIITYQLEESGSHTKYIFDANGKIQQRINAQGFSLSYEYDPSTQRLIKVFDTTAPTSRYLSFGYDGQGRLISVGDGQRSVSFGYGTTSQGDDVLDHVDDVYAQLNDGKSHRWQYIYDLDHPLYLTEVKSPSETGGITDERTEYDFSSGIGRAVRQFDGLGTQIFEISFDPSIRQATVVDALGHSRTQTYDWRNTLESSANPYGKGTSKNYDDHFNPQAVSDPNQNLTTMRWSEDGIDLEEVVDPLGNATQLDYDPATHLVTTTLDPLQYQTTYTYDGLKLETINQRLSGTQVATTTYTYTTAADAPQPAGLIKNVIDASGIGIDYQYYENGKIWKATQSGQTTTFTYDGFGHVQSATEPTGQVRWSCYDLAGRVTRSVSSASAPVGNPCDVENFVPRAEDRVQDTVYDAVGNPIFITAPNGIKTRTYYDANHRPVAVVENWTGTDLTNDTPPDRDPTHPDRNIRTDTVYDKAGNVIATIAPDGVITRTYYDNAYRPVYVTHNLVSQPIDETYLTPPAYDPNAPDHNVSTQTIYDDAGNSIVKVAPNGIKTRTYYDANNRPFAVVENWTGTDLTDNTPPDRDLTHPDQNVRTDTVYDAAGNMIATIDPNGVITRTYFDPLNRPEYRVHNMPFSLYDDPAYAETPPFELASTDENIITQMVFDDAGKQLASFYYDVDPDHPANKCQVTKNVDAQTSKVTVSTNAYCIVTRNYYDAHGRPTVTVQNLVGQVIEYGPTAGAATPPPYTAPDQNVPGPTTVYDTTGRAIAQTLPNPNDPNNAANRIVNRIYFDAWGRAKFSVRNLKPNNGQDPLGDTPPDVPGYNPSFPDQNVPTAETRYDVDGRPITSIDASGSINRTYYDSLGRISKVTRNLKDPNNPSATVDQLLQLSEPPAYDNSNPDHADWNVTIETIYDIAGRAIATVTAPKTGCAVMHQTDGSVTATSTCNVTRTYYDRLGRAYAVVRNLSGQAITDENLPPSISLTNESNVITYTLYDENSRAIAVIDPNPLCVVSHSQNGSWNIGGNCVVHRTFYDALGRVIAQVKNLTGQSFTVTTPPERETRQPIVPFYTHADQNVRTDFVYDNNGNGTDTKDPNGVVTHLVYDPLGRLTDVYENYLPGQVAAVDVNVHTQYTYDARGNRRTIRSANAVKAGTQDLTRFTYDRLDRLAGEHDPLNHGTAYGYDVLGNRSSVIDAKGFETKYVYDSLNRLKTVDNPADDADTHFTYLLTDQRQTMVDGVGTTTWAYSATGQVKSVVDPDHKKVEYRYDGVGNRTRLTYPDQKTVTYDFDGLGRLKTVTDWNNQVTSYTYAENGSLYQVSRPNGFVSTYMINAVGWLTDLKHTGNGTDVAAYHYEYEPVGNRWQASEMLPNRTYLPVIMNEGDGTQSLAPDQLQPGDGLEVTIDPYPAPDESTIVPDEGTEEANPYPAPDAPMPEPQGSSFWDQVIGFFTWLFSPADTVQASSADQGYPAPGGSPPASTSSASAPSMEITYLYDQLHRLTQADYTSGSYFHYTYDSNGNRLTETTPTGTKTASYDAANRLTSVNGTSYSWDDNGNLANDGVYQYEYDHANRLTKVKNQAEATLATFTYNGMGDRTAENNTHFVLDLNTGLTQVLQDETNTYLYGIDRMMQQSAAGTDYFLPDALGSVRQLASATGEVTLTQSFSPYGEQLSRTGTGASSFGFTGEWADSSVKLLFLRSRYYSDDMGRFLTRDTWQGDYTQPLTLNGWNYVNSNPVNFTDPSGHCIFTGVDTVACIVALAVGIPVVAGVTTASWDYFVTQGGGYGGFNQYQQDCIDISQVLDAGKGGTLGALSSEGFTIASIPLGPTYLFAYLVHHETPTEVNMNILSAFGLADEYQNALGNPYFFAGQSGGNAGMTYISLASFLKGLPNLVNLSSRTFSNPITQPGGLLANKMILTLPGIEVVGGSGELVYIGTAGMAQQLSMFARGNNWPQAQAGEAQIRKIIESEPDWELLGEQVDIEVITKNGARTRRVDFLVRNKPDNSIFAVEVKTGPNAVLRPRQESLDAIMEQQGGTIISHKVPPAYFGRYVYKIGTIVINLY